MRPTHPRHAPVATHTTRSSFSKRLVYLLFHFQIPAHAPLYLHHSVCSSNIHPTVASAPHARTSENRLSTAYPSQLPALSLRTPYLPANARMPLSPLLLVSLIRHHRPPSSPVILPCPVSYILSHTSTVRGNPKEPHSTNPKSRFQHEALI